MKHPLLVTGLALTLAMLACHFPSGGGPTPSSVYDLPTTTPASLTPRPTLGPTPSVATVFTGEQGVHCRLGPGTVWAPVSSVAAASSAQIVGRNADGSWWYIRDPFNSGQRCWVAASVTTASGDLAGIPVVTATEASVTGATLTLEPETIQVPGCTGPAPAIRLTGTIAASGPVAVAWHLETQAAGALPERTVTFGSAGEKEFTADYTPPAPLTAGTYWVRLIVTSPNALEAEATYTLECP